MRGSFLSSVNSLSCRPQKLQRCFCLSRHVSTWTPLAATFNKKPHKKLSFAFSRDRKGLFGYPQLADSKGFYLMKEQSELAAERLVREATSSTRTRNVVEIFDELSDSLCKVADLAECVRVLHNDSEFVVAAEDTNNQMNGIVEELNTNRPLYNALKKVAGSGDINPMDEVDRHVAQLFLHDFEQAGIHLEEDKRKQVVELNARILAAGTSFLKRCHDPRYVAPNTIPEELHQFFPMESSYIAVHNLMSDSSEELVREAAYKIFLMPDKHQSEPLQELLYRRYQLARLVGFPSYSARANIGSVFQNTGTISNFLETLSAKLRPLAQEDRKYMLQLKQEMNPGAEKLYPWDTAYFMAVARQERTQIDISELTPYFPLGACIEGLSQLFESLYRVHFVIEDTSCGEDLWADDVYKLSVRTRNDEVLGYIYCDFFERQTKSHQDCHFTIRCGRQLSDGSYQLPIVVLSLNFTPPEANVPCLLQFWQIDNLFHEMGHAMHSMLGRTRYQHVTGTRCSTDFAEVPSSLMEQFAADSRVLARISRHYQTGASLSENTLKQLNESRRICSATEYLQQAFYSITDQAFHGPTAPSDTMEIYASLYDRHIGPGYVPNTAWHLRFGHLVGYGARYYSYLLARSVASDIWQRLFEADPYSREAGKKFRDRLLCHGGGRPPLELVSSVLEHTPSTDELVDALVRMTKPVVSSPQ